MVILLLFLCRPRVLVYLEDLFEEGIPALTVQQYHILKHVLEIYTVQAEQDQPAGTTADPAWNHRIFLTHQYYRYTPIRDQMSAIEEELRLHTVVLVLLNVSNHVVQHQENVHTCLYLILL